MVKDARGYRPGAEATAPVQAFLIALNPALGHREYRIGPEPVVIGRQASQCDIVVAGRTVSRMHCRIVPRADGAFGLLDLHSTNGVFVNRRRLHGETVLAEGDRIGLGTARIDYLCFQRHSGRNRPWTLELPPQAAWTIGRSPHADVGLVFESAISALHATVRRRGERVQILDQGSLNGTWVNGRRVRKAVLEATDAVMIGSTVLRFQSAPDGGLRVLRQDCGEGIALECVQLTYEVPGRRLPPKPPKRLLDHLTLAIRPGEFVGILGPSGAGKSTLLKALNGHTPPSYGCTLLNGMALYRSLAMFRHAIGYVPQDDIVHPELTVRACLDYVARLRLPPDVDAEQRGDLIDTTLESLGLSHVGGNRISDLSGGQRKRVSIGCELITRPSILFLDEPTSGMDPSTEERLMRHFQALARRGTTVLITTHILYNLPLLDRVVILARGRLVFFGTPREALAFFAAAGKPLERPTEIFDLLEGLDSTPVPGSDPRETLAVHYQRQYRESELFRRHVRDPLSEFAGDLLNIGGGFGKIDDCVDQAAAGPAHRDEYRGLLREPSGAARRFGLDLFSWRSFVTLTRRQFAIKLVSPKRALFYFLVPIILALVTLSLRTQALPTDAAVAADKAALKARIEGGGPTLGPALKQLLSTQGAADPRPPERIVFALKHEGLPNLPTPISVLLMMVMTAIFIGTLTACLELSTERAVYRRERMADLKIADYLASKLPFLGLLTALQCGLFLGLCRLGPEMQPFDWPAAYLAMVAMAWVAAALGLALSALDPTPGQFSVILAIAVVLPQLILSGAMAPDFYAGMAPLTQRLADLLPARWGLEMLLTAFYDQPQRAAIAWIAEFVPGTMGLRFGAGIYGSNTLILAAQALAWLALCAWLVRRQDRIR